MPGSVALFKRYLSPILVETGTYAGMGVKMALEAGFDEIRTVELGDELHERNLKRFANRPQVKLFHGKSDEMLWEMIQDIKVPVTFWLDAHYSAGDTVKAEVNCPLMRELAVIARHPIKTHTILIDDRRKFGSWEFDDVTEEMAREFIRGINSAYVFSYDTGSAEREEFLEDVMVARVGG